jgi:hypothetical protein
MRNSSLSHAGHYYMTLYALLHNYKYRRDILNNSVAGKKTLIHLKIQILERAKKREISEGTIPNSVTYWTNQNHIGKT